MNKRSRKALASIVAAVGLMTAAVSSVADTPPARGDRTGPGMMGGMMGGHGPGSGMGPGMMGSGMMGGMMGGYGRGYGMGPGMMGGMMGGCGQGYGMGPGMMGPGMMGPGMMGGMMGGYGQGYGMGHGMMGGVGMEPGMMLHGLDLSNEQRDRIDGIWREQSKKQRELGDKMLEERSKLNGLLRSDKRDTQAIVAEYGKLQELERAGFQARLEAREKIEGVLSKEQRDQLRRRTSHQSCS